MNNTYNKLNVHKENHEKKVINHMANGLLSVSDATMDVNHANQLLDKEFTCTESVASEVSDSSKTDSEASRTPLAVSTERAPQNPIPSRTAKVNRVIYFTCSRRKSVSCFHLPFSLFPAAIK